MQNNIGTSTPTTINTKNIDKTLRQIYQEINYFPEDYDDAYQPPSDFLDNDNTLKHACALIDSIFWGGDRISKQKICELLRNISLSEDAAELAGLISRYAFINHEPFEDVKFADFMKEGRSYEPVN